MTDPHERDQGGAREHDQQGEARESVQGEARDSVQGEARRAYKQSEALRQAPSPREDGASAHAGPASNDPHAEVNDVTADDVTTNRAPQDGAPVDPLDPHAPPGEAVTAEGHAVDAEVPAEPRDPIELAMALVDAERSRDDYLDALRRERAEFENFRKRNARERLEAMDRGVQSLATELLGVLDNFGHVLKAAEDSPDEALAKGARMVHEELIGVLTRFGLEVVPGEGEPFDPQWHEAMMQVPAEGDADEPVVAQVLREGYRFKGRVLRPASVSVAQ